VPVPAAYTVPNSGENASAAFLMPDGNTVTQNQPFTRCAAGGPATTLVTWDGEDIRGDGIAGAHGGSGLSALGGTIRVGELAAGRISHAMKIELWAAQYYACCAPHWPASQVDGYANGQTYGGQYDYLGPGSLLALAPTFDRASLQTAPAKILARGLQDYGAYVVDDVYANGWSLVTEQGPNGSVADEAMKLFGVSLSPKDGDPFMSDIVTLFEALQVVTNNSASNVGGGGAPRASLAPPVGN
jgi:hypothetical protein